MRRRLGYIETLCAIGQDELLGAVQGVGVLEIVGPLTSEVVRAALVQLQARHPLLRARIERSADGYEFVVDEHPPAIVFTAREQVDEHDWRAVEIAEHEAPIDPRSPLWRVVLLHDPAGQRHTLLLSYHHAIADGMARLLVMDELLRLCAAGLAGASLQLPGRPLPPAIEPQLAQRTDWAGYTAATQADAAGQPALDPWPFVRPAPLAARQPHVLHRVIAADVVTALRRRAAAEATTVHAGIAAAMLLAAVDLAGGSLRTSLGTSVDLRPFADPAPDPADLGCFMINVRTAHVLASGGELWPLARDYRAQLQARLPAQAFTPYEFDFAALHGKFSRASVEQATQYPYRLGLSNLGVYPYPERHGPLQLVRLQISTSRRAGLYAGFMHVVTLGGRMFLGLSYVEPLLASAWAEAFVDAVAEKLGAATR